MTLKYNQLSNVQKNTAYIYSITKVACLCKHFVLYVGCIHTDKLLNKFKVTSNNHGQ